MESALPDGWASITLNDALETIVGGGTPSKENPEYFQGSIPLMTVKDMKEPRPSSTGFNITEEALKNSSAKLVPADTVIIATRMGLGKVVRPMMETAINQDLKALFPNSALTKTYLEKWLTSIASKIEAMGTGTTVKGVRLNQIRQLTIPLAPLNEQYRIVEKIEALFSQLDHGEAALRDVKKLLTRYRQSILKAAVTGELTGTYDDLHNKNIWQKVRLGNLLTDIRYGTAKKCHTKNDGIAVLRIPNVVKGTIDLQDLKFTHLEEKELEKLSLKEGDVLIVRSNGSANLVGRAAVVNKAAVGLAFAGYLIRLRLDQDQLLPKFLRLILDSPQVRANIERHARSTSGVHNINSSEIKSIDFQLPPISLQKEILGQFEIYMNEVEQLEMLCKAELARSSALRQSILKEAFSGKLVLQDPDDEPASKLLTRVREERSVQPKVQTRNKITA